MVEYSVIVPVYNEAGNVKQLADDIHSVMGELGLDYELLFINDGSEDDTLGVLRDLKNITIIDFRKNFGQTAAMDAGFKHAQGKYFITLDGDGQNPPDEIPKLINAIKSSHYDVISGWRADRKDTFAKRFVSRVANFLRSFLVKDNIHDSGCSLKIYKRECFDGLDLHGEMHRFIPAVLRWHGFKVGEIKVDHKERLVGKSKYNWKRTVKGFVDMISVWFWRKYSNRPLHLFGGVGMAMFLCGGLIFVLLLAMRLFASYPLSDKIWPLIAALMMIMGVQFFVSGIMTDILVKNYYKGERMPYLIKTIDRL